MNYIRYLYDWWKQPRTTIWGDYAQSIITIALAAFIIRTWGFGLYQVPTCSMETTMLVGERFFADKFNHQLRFIQTEFDKVHAGRTSIKKSLSLNIF